MKLRIRKRYLFAFIIAAAIFACAWFAFSAQSGPEADEVAVYSTLFAPRELGHVGSTIVIFDGTQRGFGDVVTSDEEFRKVIDYLRQDIPDVEQETWDDFYTKNQQSHSLKERFNRSALNPFRLGLNIVVVNDEDLSMIFNYADSEQNPWEKFEAKYSGAREVYFLSRVGFNHARNQALVHVSYECGALCGGGDYVLLEKKFGFWLIQKRHMSWIS